MIKEKIRLLFPPSKSDEPLITTLVKDYNVTVNILRASINEGKKGRMILNISGEQEDVDRAIAFLENSDLMVDVYTQSVIHYKEQCVECGACVGVCPSKALTMNAPEYVLEFDVKKCVLCGLCVKACPVRAISFFDDNL